MALRIRKDGRILCAALNEPEDGDLYVDDHHHYQLSVEKNLLVTTEINKHIANGGEWWWRGQEPEGVEIAPQYFLNSPKT